MKEFLSKHRWPLLLIAALLAGFAIRGCLAPAPRGEPREAEAGAKPPEEAPKWWTCSMHPQIRQPKPGLCPICNMALIPVKEEAGEGGLRRFTTSKAARALMDIQTAPVERRFVEAEVRMVGKVAYDETRVGYITAWVPGRIDRLFVDYTGIAVRKGDHMVYLYSPELLTAQQELIQALRALRDTERSDVQIIKETAQATVEAVREKLRLWGLTQEQVAEIEKRGAAADHMTIYAPMGGIVVHKNVTEGMYVKTGTRIYTLADLSRIWVKLDAYESDLVWLHYGQRVTFTTEAYRGEAFEGTIAFISPVLDPKTRTVDVRLNVRNEDARLKPDMLVRAVARSRVDAKGRAMAPELAGKWICPMHPEVIKDTAGACDVCQMDLVRTESLGYVPLSEEGAEKPLIIPATAPLITGARAVVYVEVPGADRPTFEGREIVLGPRAGDSYIVRSGLKEGEHVVIQGNFKIDSALQILARPSMMTPEGGGGGMQHRHGPAPAAGGDSGGGGHQHE